MKEVLTTDQIKKLNEPLPPEALKPHPTKSYLSTIKSIYVIERLNQVFGVGGWKVVNEIIEKQVKEKTSKDNKPYTETMVIVKSVFTTIDGNIYIESFGGNDNDDLGDAYKGACTDALTKIGSYLGIGADIWKDKQKAPNSPAPSGGAPAGSQEEKPWLSQEKFEEMKKYILEGKGKIVKDKMNEYKIRKNWKSELEELIAKTPSN